MESPLHARKDTKKETPMDNTIIIVNTKPDLAGVMPFIFTDSS